MRAVAGTAPTTRTTGGLRRSGAAAAGRTRAPKEEKTSNAEATRRAAQTWKGPITGRRRAVYPPSQATTSTATQTTSTNQATQQTHAAALIRTVSGIWLWERAWETASQRGSARGSGQPASAHSAIGTPATKATS